MVKEEEFFYDFVEQIKQAPTLRLHESCIDFRIKNEENLNVHRSSNKEKSSRN